MVFIFDPQPAVDVSTGRLVAESGISGTVHASEADANADVNPLTVTVAGGVSTPNVPVSPFGLTAMFSHPTAYQVWWRSGAYVVRLLSFDSIVTAVEASSASAQAASDSAVAVSEDTAALREWVNKGATIRNLVTDPQATTAARWAATGGSTATEELITGATDGPVLPDGTRVTTYARYTITAAGTGNAIYGYDMGSALIPVVPTGKSLAIAVYVRSSLAVPSISVRKDAHLAGVAAGSSQSVPSSSLPAATWQRRSGIVVNNADFDQIRIGAQFPDTSRSNGQVIDVVCAMLVVDAATVPDHFYGDSPDTNLVGNAWAGTPNASASERIDLSGLVRSVNGETPDSAGNVVVAAGGDGTATWSTLSGKPSTFPPSAHSHLRSEISDASTLGRSIMSAADAQAARNLIGAGTGNGTSNLALGTTATTAAPGNHGHAQYIDSAQAATIADERIAASGGGGGGGSILPWIYRSGAYPTLPATAPAGVMLVTARGPVAPSVLPSWVGNGPTQVPADYVYNGDLA